MKIGIYGGSFNPPHLGHLAAARAAVDALELDRLVFVPAGQPPHKELAPGSPTAEQRLDMTAIAADQLLLPDKAGVWDLEVRRAGKSYSADTVEEAARRWPGAELWLLTGTDMFLTLQDWHDPERIMAAAGICAFGRATQDGGAPFAAQRDALARRFGARVRVIHIPDLVEVSSTQVRQALSQGRGREYLPRAVYGYILREKLYGTCADLSRLDDEDLRCVSASMVMAKRLAHIAGTEKEAERLARRWGADPDQLCRAAILHDCTKYLSLEEHLAICDRYGVPLDEMERRTEKLLHAKSGAALAKYVFGQDDGAFQAILYHTTARAGMTLAEKILYTADYMEPNRDFPEVAELRRLAYEDLDRAVLMGVRLSIRDMLQRGRTVHPNTLKAEAFLSEKGIRK